MAIAHGGQIADQPFRQLIRRCQRRGQPVLRYRAGQEMRTPCGDQAGQGRFQRIVHDHQDRAAGRLHRLRQRPYAGQGVHILHAAEIEQGSACEAAQIAAFRTLPAARGDRLPSRLYRQNGQLLPLPRREDEYRRGIQYQALLRPGFFILDLI